MVEMSIEYHGELRCVARHGPSGATIQTDAPVDNHGRGEAFSPTDLVGVALGTCMLTTMAIFAQRKGIELRGTKVHVAKHMVADPVRRIGKLEVRFVLPPGLALSDEQRQMLENAASTCPVHRALHGHVDIPVTYEHA